MSEAGKDANARPQNTDSDSLPLRTLSRVAPQSVQIAKDHAIVAKSAWCGLVFSLAVVITVLNVLPPIPVGYRVTSQVLASPQRVEALKKQLVQHRETLASLKDIEDESHPECVLVSVRVLDDQSKSKARRPANWQVGSEHDHDVLLEVVSQWKQRTTTGKVHRWLEELTKADNRVARQVDSGRSERFSRWEVQVQQHYLKQFRQSQARLAEAAQQDSQSESDGTTDRVPTRLASMSTGTGKTPSATLSATLASSPRSTIVTGNPSNSASEIEEALVRELEQAAAREKSANVNVQQDVSRLSGSLTVSGSPRVHAAPGNIPTVLLFSMFILTVASAAIGGWANHRAHSGGTFYAEDVAATMQLLGLPILASVELPRTQLDGMDVAIQRRLSNYRRWLVSKSLALSELILLIWCMAITIRVVLDPLWRALLWENPLAGLSRLFTGLP